MRKLTKKQKKALIHILISGTILLILGILSLTKILPNLWYIRLPLFLIPYLPIGIDVWRKAFANLFHGQLLDENFLMTLATVGAFAIGEYPEGVFVMLFYQVGELFQSIAVGKSRRSISALMEIKPDEARVMRDGTESTVSPDEVSVGEIIVIRPGEKIPLDGEIIEGSSDLNTLSLTGEALPRSVKTGDSVISGCINLSGVLRVRVTKPFGESTVSKILELVEHSSMVKSKAENAVTKFAHWYTPLVVAGAVLLATVPPIFLGDFTRWLRSAFIFLVISCPCALVISVPLSFFSGIGKASRAGILVKGANYLEALSNVDTVVFDKTGTLTSGVFSVTSIHPAEGVSEQELLSLAGAAEQHSNHPIARSVLDACSNLTLPSAGETEEFPGMGISALVGGKKLLVGNEVLMDSVGLSVSKAKSVGTELFVSFDNRFLGSILISDTLKSDAKETMISLRKNGVRKTVMLTGDRKAVADAVASALDLDFYQADLLPADKVSAVESLLSTKRGTLVFVGDGVNDAPVLARADVGIAMGALGSDAAIEAADVVLMDDKPSKIATALSISRFTKKIVTENIWFAIFVKILFLILSIFNLTNMWAATFADVGVAVIAILNAMR